MSQLSRNPKESARAKGYEDAFKIFILDVGLLGALFRKPNRIRFNLMILFWFNFKGTTILIQKLDNALYYK